MKCAGNFYAFPAHHKPLQPLKRLRIVCADALCCNLAPLSEVVIGNVEPTMSFALITECGGKVTKFYSIKVSQTVKNTKK